MSEFDFSSFFDKMKQLAAERGTEYFETNDLSPRKREASVSTVIKHMTPPRQIAPLTTKNSIIL